MLASTALISSPMVAVLVVIVISAGLIAVAIVGGHLVDLIFDKYDLKGREKL